MKKLCLSILTIIVLFAFSSCNILNFGFFEKEKRGLSAYEADYAKEYENTLNVMFDNNWTVKSVETKYDEGEEDCTCGYAGINPHTYWVWTIEYHDGNGELKTFVFNNLGSFSAQIEWYVLNYTADYYKENFYDIYTKDWPLASSAGLYASFAEAPLNKDKSEENTRKSYSDKFDIPEGAICFSKLTPAGAFEMFPIYFTINVDLDEDFNEAFKENAVKQIEAMTKNMNEFANNKLTANVCVSNLRDGNNYYYQVYIQGERQFFGIDGEFEGFVFENRVFESYKDMFE